MPEITRKLRTEAGNATHFVVFDACRNALTLQQPGSRAIVQSKGFVPVAQESGMLIAYATAEGELASDIGSGAGPYARALAEEIVKPGIEAVVMFRAVQRRVRAAIHQDPYLGFNALGDVYFSGKPNTTNATGEVERAWAAVKDTKSIEVLQSFIERYTDTIYAELARAQQRDLETPQRNTQIALEMQVKHRDEAEKQAKEQRAEELNKLQDNQAGGLFTRPHLERVKSLAERHGFILPNFEIELPAMGVPAELRRFIGVWVDETGGEVKGKKNMMIVTRVDKNGQVEGWMMSGPPTPTSTDRGPAGILKIAGKITGDTLRFSNRDGTLNYSQTLVSANRLNYLWWNSKGQTATRVFNPVWLLVEAERSVKR